MVREQQRSAVLLVRGADGKTRLVDLSDVQRVIEEQHRSTSSSSSLPAKGQAE